jgi:hypothetical protein
VDVDRSGEIDRSEFQQLFLRLGIRHVHIDDVDDLFAHIDTDGGGTVGYTEMWNFYTKNFDIEAGVIDMPATKSNFSNQFLPGEEVLQKARKNIHDQIVYMHMTVGRFLGYLRPDLNLDGKDHAWVMAQTFTRARLKEVLRMRLTATLGNEIGVDMLFDAARQAAKKIRQGTPDNGRGADNHTISMAQFMQYIVPLTSFAKGARAAMECVAPLGPERKPDAPGEGRRPLRPKGGGTCGGVGHIGTAAGEKERLPLRKPIQPSPLTEGGEKGDEDNVADTHGAERKWRSSERAVQMRKDELRLQPKAKPQQHNLQNGKQNGASAWRSNASSGGQIVLSKDGGKQPGGEMANSTARRTSIQQFLERRYGQRMGSPETGGETAGGAQDVGGSQALVVTNKTHGQKIHGNNGVNPTPIKSQLGGQAVKGGSAAVVGRQVVKRRLAHGKRSNSGGSGGSGQSSSSAKAHRVHQVAHGNNPRADRADDDRQLVRVMAQVKGYMLENHLRTADLFVNKRLFVPAGQAQGPKQQHVCEVGARTSGWIQSDRQIEAQKKVGYISEEMFRHMLTNMSIRCTSSLGQKVGRLVQQVPLIYTNTDCLSVCLPTYCTWIPTTSSSGRWIRMATE